MPIPPFASAPGISTSNADLRYLRLNTINAPLTGALPINVSSTAALDIQNGSAVSAFKFDSTSTTGNTMTINGTAAQDGASISANLVTSLDFTDPTFWSPNSTTWTTTVGTCTHVIGNTTPMISTTSVMTPSAGDYSIIVTISGLTNIDTDGVIIAVGGTSAPQLRGNGTFTVGAAATGATTLRMTPTSNFDGTISVLQAKRITNTPARITTLISPTFGNGLSSQWRTDFQGNNFIGKNAGRSLQFGSGVNFTMGDNTMGLATTASNNVAVGSSALQNITVGGDNFALGGQTLARLTTGFRCIGIGISSIAVAVTASDIIGIGEQSWLAFTGTVGEGTGIGVFAGRSVTRGRGQTYIGYSAGYQDPTLTAWKTITNLQYSGAIGYAAQIQIANAITIGGQGAQQTNVGFGTTSPSNFMSVSPDMYDTGTASRSGTTITGSGTTWTAEMVGAEFIFADGTKSRITAFGGVTSLTCVDSGTVASQIYRIHKQAFQVTTDGKALIYHAVGNATVPTIAAGTGAGTSPTIAITGTDVAGKITITTGTLPTLSADVFTVTFQTAFATAPYVTFSPGNGNAAALNGLTMVYVTPATGTFKFTAGATALAAATQYIWYYTVIG